MSRTTPQTDSIAQACKGDSQAFAALADDLYRTVYGIAFSTVGNWSAAQDIAQETFLIAWTRRESLRNSRAFPAWIRCISANLSKNWLRSKDYRRKLANRYGATASPESPSETADNIIDIETRRTEVWRALENLAPNLREVIVLYYLNESSLRDVALSLDISENTAKKRLQLGRAKLRAHFEKQWKSEIAKARETIGAHSARDRFLAGIVIGPAAPELAKSAAKAGIGLWWEITKQSGVLHKAALGGSIMTAKKATLAGIACLLLIGGAAWVTQHATKSPANPPNAAPVLAESTTAKHQTSSASPSAPTTPTPNRATSAELVITPVEIDDPKDYATVNGVVLDENNAPVPGAKVTIAALGLPKPPEGGSRAMMNATVKAYDTYIADPGHYWSATTDANGGFEIKGIRYAGMALVTASAENYVAAMKPIYLEATSTPETITLHVRPGVTLRGRLWSADGKPVTDGSLRLVSLISPDAEQSGAIGLAVLTDAEGRFELAADMKGIMSINVNSATYGPTAFTNVEADPDQEINLRYTNGATIYGRVTDEKNKPLPKTEVRLTGTIATVGRRPDGSASGGSSAAGTALSVQTGDDGTFRFENVNTNQVYESAVYSAEGSLLLEGRTLQDIEPGASVELNMIVQPLITVTGVVYGQQSKRPLPNVDVTAFCSRPANTFDHPDSTARTKAGNDGSYRLVITGAGGTYEIIPALTTETAIRFANGESVKQPGSQTVTLKPGDTQTLDLYVPDPLTRSFLVVDEDGNPVPGAAITVTQDIAGLGVSETTDAKGRVTLSALPAQIPITISFHKDGYVYAESETLIGKPGDTLPEETVVMYRAASFIATLLDDSGQPLANRQIFIAPTDATPNDNRAVVADTDANGTLTLDARFPATTVSLEFSTTVETNGVRKRIKARIENIVLTAKTKTDLGTLTLSAP